VLIPLYGFVRGDTLGLLVLAHAGDTVQAVANSLRQAACMRVAPASQARLYHDGVLLDPGRTIEELGLTALARIDLVPEAEG
jgi:hypothetical protein